jgi:hypothetical protein
MQPVPIMGCGERFAMVTCVGRGSSIQARRYLKPVAMVIHGHSTSSRVDVHSQAICQ